MARKSSIVQPARSAANASSVVDEINSFEFANLEHPAKAMDLSDLKLWPPRQGERGKCFPIWLELRIAEETIITDDWRITVHLTRAEIAASFEGCHIAPGTRYGDDPLPPSVESNETELDVKDYMGRGEVSGELSSSLTRGLSADATMKMAGKAEVRSKTATERKSKVVHYRVAALPNNRWEVVEPNGRLRGSYLVAPADEETSDKPLCRVIANSETLSISLSLEVRPHDIDPVITPRESNTWVLWSVRKKPNKIKIAKLLITRACTDGFARPDDERLTLARAVLQGKRLVQRGRFSNDSSE